MSEPEAGPSWRSPQPLVRRYWPAAYELLKAHNLAVPSRNVDLIAETIMVCRVRVPGGKKARGTASARQRLKKALTHAQKLLQYTERRPTHRESVATRSDKLRRALDDRTVVVWLATASPSIDVPHLLDKLGRGGRLARSELTELVRALRSILSRPSTRPGRPTERKTRVIRAGCTAWLRADRRAWYRWNDATGELRGPLPKFICELLAHCDGSAQRIKRLESSEYVQRLLIAKRRQPLALSHAALHSALIDALPDCKAALAAQKRRTSPP